MEYAGKLRDVLPIHILEQSDKEDLARQMHVRHFKADEVIYHQGDPAGDAHVVSSANARSSTTVNGDEAVIAVIPTTTLPSSDAMWAHYHRRNEKPAVLPPPALDVGASSTSSGTARTASSRSSPSNTPACRRGAGTERALRGRSCCTSR